MVGLPLKWLAICHHIQLVFPWALASLQYRFWFPRPVTTSLLWPPTTPCMSMMT